MSTRTNILTPMIVSAVLATLFSTARAQSAPATATTEQSAAATASSPDEEEAAETLGSAPASAPDTSPLPKATDLRQGLQLDWAENQILDSVRDGDRRKTDNGLYVLLRRAASLPELNQSQYDALDQISANSLLESPRRFRALPMRLTMRVWRVQKWTFGDGLRANPRWPKNRPVWWIGGIDFTGRNPSKRQIIVLSTVDPTPALGTPDKTLEDGTVFTYPNGRYLEVAGLFYKVYQDVSVGSENSAPALMSYPIVVAWQVGRNTGPSSSFDWMTAAAFISLAVLGILFFVFRRRVSQMKKDNPEPGRGRYRPLREEEPAPARQEPPPVDGEVDPALREAAERFRKEKNG